MKYKTEYWSILIISNVWLSSELPHGLLVGGAMIVFAALVLFFDTRKA